VREILGQLDNLTAVARFVPHVSGKQVDHDAQQHADSQAAERLEQARQNEVLQSVFYEVQRGCHDAGDEQTHH